jgi:hypothetical protein
MNTDKPTKPAGVKSQSPKPTPEVVSARVGELQVLVAMWIKDNPRVATTHMVVDGLKLLFKQKGYAGKRYAHLVN